MNDRRNSPNEFSEIDIDSIEKKARELPIKKCHFLEGKYFIVIDKTIAKLLNFSRSENTELYFQQEVSEDCIILRPFKWTE